MTKNILKPIPEGRNYFQTNGKYDSYWDFDGDCFKSVIALENMFI